jgi:hypothetical protein
MRKLRNTIAATMLLASLVGSTQLAQASGVGPGRRLPSVPEAWSPEGRALYSVSVPEAWSLEGRAS